MHGHEAGLTMLNMLACARLLLSNKMLSADKEADAVKANLIVTQLYTITATLAATYNGPIIGSNIAGLTHVASDKS